MATRLLHSPSRGLAASPHASRSTCARPAVAALSSGNAPLRQARGSSSHPQQPSAAAVHAQRLAPAGAVAQPQHAAPHQAAQSPAALEQREALLCQRFNGHTAAITTLLVLTDTDDRQQILTASLDKSIALWSSWGADELPEHSLTDSPPACLIMESAMRLKSPAAPVFSMSLDNEACGSGLRQVFLGTAAKQVLAWEPPQPEFVGNVALGGHTGWVRALAQHGRWLFSCSCNTIQQWDMSRAVPRHCATVASFKGDILAACTGNGTLFTAGANGNLRSWAISKGGELTPASSNKTAHSDRVTAAAWHAGFLYTASADGFVKMWDSSLELVTQVRAAHGGGKVHALVVGRDGLIYTGGDDKLIRRWRAGVSSAGLLAEAAPPLFCHHAPVRALAAGPKHTIVSGDARGDIAVWHI